jgi:Transposase IS66 family
MALSPHEITARMTELRNLRKLHGAQKVRIRLLQEENKTLKTRIATLEGIVEEQATTIAELKLQIAELRTMVFGKKPTEKRDDGDIVPPPPKTPRTNDSYHRPLPKASDITEEKHHSIDTCTHCKGAFSERDSIVYFEEDIPLP